LGKRTTVFEAGDERYRADTCAALITARESGELTMAAVARGTYPGRRLPPGMLPQVSTLGYWDAAHDQGWGLGEHRNEGVEITYLANGHLGFMGDRGDSPPLVAGKELPGGSATPGMGVGLPELGRLLDMAQTGDPPASRLGLAVNELLVCVHELLRAQDPPRKPSLTLGERSVAMFLDRWRDRVGEPWTLGLMAERLGLGRTRFAHHCRKLTNLAPMAYLQHLRVELAKLQLATTAKSMTEIALDCGFGSSAYFSSVFRAVVQCTPREYRERSTPHPAKRGSQAG